MGMIKEQEETFLLKDESEQEEDTLFSKEIKNTNETNKEITVSSSLVNDYNGILYDSSDHLQETSKLTKYEYNKWCRLVLIVSYLSIVSQFALGIVAIVQGLQIDSSGTFGFGIESIMDMLTTVVVVWRFYGSDKFCEQKEKRATLLLALLMVIFSIGVTVKAIFGFINELTPIKEIHLIIICSVGLSLYVMLAWAKLVLSAKIKSQALFMDAMCTFGAAGMSLALLSSFIVYHYTNLWYLDSIVAILIALGMIGYGAYTLYKTHLKKMNI